MARFACHTARPPVRKAPCNAGELMSDSSVSEPRSVDASLRQHHAASRLVSKNVMARLTRFPMRADADATERSGGIVGNDTSALCAQSTCMALVGDNTGDAFSPLIAFSPNDFSPSPIF